VKPNLNGWERPSYRAGAQAPFIFLVAFGADPGAEPLSRSRFQCDGMPKGTDLQGYSVQEHPGYLEDLRSGYLWEAFNARDAALAARVAACESCIVLAGDVTDAMDLLYLRDMIGVGEWLFACGAAVIYDPQAFTWWSREDWHSGLFAAGEPQPHKHVQILHSDEDGGHWLHTRGLRLFGRPDISVRNVPESAFGGATTMVNRLIAYQALGGVIEDGLEVSLNGLPDGLICRPKGDLEDPDFNNFHVEIVWPG
jgi:hypothetical protein